MLTLCSWPRNDGAAIANAADAVRGRRCGQTKSKTKRPKKTKKKKKHTKSQNLAKISAHVCSVVTVRRRAGAKSITCAVGAADAAIVVASVMSFLLRFASL